MSAEPAPSRLAQRALVYAAHGWHVFPVQPRAKQPLVAHGYLEASIDPRQLGEWWARWPNANIGLAPGRSGLVVLDVDGPEGERLAGDLGLLAEPTLRAITGREGGGLHLFFRHPGFAVSNARLGEKLDVRGDMGYVLLAPSIHPSGQAYRWQNPGTPTAVLPPRALEALRIVQTNAPAAPGARTPAAEIPALEVIGEGGRNDTLTRYVGRLLAKRHTPTEAYELALAINDTRCRPPLPVAEVWAIVQSLAAKELRKPERQTSTGSSLALVPPEQSTEPESVPDFVALASGQAEAAIARGRLDLSGAPRWQWHDLHRLVGEMLPGDFWVLGSLMGNGKTSLLLSQMDWFADHEVTTVYLPLELDPKDLRRRWAAWKLDLDPVAVARNHWHLLPEGSQDAHESMIADQAKNPHVHFPPDKRISLTRLAWWIRHGIQEVGARIIVIDHFHRLDFGGATAQYRVLVTDTVRAMKDLARDHGVVILASAQLNQSDANPLDRFHPPEIRRLKESAGIGEEADVVLMASRRLKTMVSHEDLAAIRMGFKSVREAAEPNIMNLTCRKHRLDDALAGDRTIRLRIERGRVTDAAPEYREYQDWNRDA